MPASTLAFTGRTYLTQPWHQSTIFNYVGTKAFSHYYEELLKNKIQGNGRTFTCTRIPTFGVRRSTKYVKSAHAIYSLFQQLNLINFIGGWGDEIFPSFLKH